MSKDSARDLGHSPFSSSIESDRQRQEQHMRSIPEVEALGPLATVAVTANKPSSRKNFIGSAVYVVEAGTVMVNGQEEPLVQGVKVDVTTTSTEIYFTGGITTQSTPPSQVGWFPLRNAWEYQKELEKRRIRGNTPLLDRRMPSARENIELAFKLAKPKPRRGLG